MKSSDHSHAPTGQRLYLIPMNQMNPMGSWCGGALLIMVESGIPGFVTSINSSGQHPTMWEIHATFGIAPTLHLTRRIT